MRHARRHCMEIDGLPVPFAVLAGGLYVSVAPQATDDIEVSLVQSHDIQHSEAGSTNVPCAAQVYAGPLEGGARAVVLFNRHSPDYRYNNMTVTWEQLGYDTDEAAVVRDMFLREDLGEYTGEALLLDDGSPMEYREC